MDVLNPSGTAKPSGVAPAPVDLFAPLAPMPMPAHLFVPSSGVCCENTISEPRTFKNISDWNISIIFFLAVF